MYREDYIIRLIKQLVEFIARAAGLNRSGKHDEALAATDEAWDQLLDAPRGMVASVDTPTLAMLLREPAKIRVAAQLCYEEARALAGKGDPVHAALRYTRAMELILEARALDPQPEDDQAILELGRHVSIDLLAPRYRTRVESAS
jgi:hypothetical protein